MKEWILCKEKQPKHFDSVLLCLKDRRNNLMPSYFYVSATYANGRYKPDFGDDNDFYFVEPYAWMPLPKP